MNLRGSIARSVTVCIVGVATFFLVPPWSPNVDVKTTTVTVDNVKRSYRVVVPNGLPESAPVVFAFHGIGDSVDSMAAYSQLDYLAAKHSFLLIYPAGIQAKWDVVVDTDPNTRDSNQDVRFFDELLVQVTEQYAIDPNRIYLLGMSNGASFVQLLANLRSSIIAAAAACSGPRPLALNDSKHAFPILLIVGADDPLSVSMKSDFDYYHTTGHTAELIVVRGLGHEWPIAQNADIWSFFANRCRTQSLFDGETPKSKPND